jgi:hypothetical protein
MTAFSITTVDNTNLPAIEAEIAAAADAAMDAGLAVIARGVRVRTRVKTGFMRDNERTFKRGTFTGMFESAAFYTSFVDKRYPFIGPGVDASEDAAAAAYERVFESEMTRNG